MGSSSFLNLKFFIAQGESGVIDAPPPTPDVPDDFNEVKQTIGESLGSIWTDFVSHTPYLVTGIVVVLLTAILSAIFRFVVSRAIGHKRMRPSLQQLMLRLVSIIVWTIGLLLTAMVVFPGLTPARALGGLGLLSVAIGLAFKDIFENFFAGVLLLWRFPFEDGDFITCEEISGRVERVEVRSSRIRLTTGELVVVPNSFLFKNPVLVLTNNEKRRVHLTVGIAYGESVEAALKVIRGALSRCDTVDMTRPLQIFPMGFGSSSVDIDVAWWAESTPVGQRKSRGEVLQAIKEDLDEAGIEIPFPYRTLTFKEDLGIRRLDGEGEE